MEFSFVQFKILKLWRIYTLTRCCEMHLCCVGSGTSPPVWVKCQWQDCWWPQCTRHGRGGEYQRAALNFPSVFCCAWAALWGTYTIHTTRWATLHIHTRLQSKIILLTFNIKHSPPVLLKGGSKTLVVCLYLNIELPWCMNNAIQIKLPCLVGLPGFTTGTINSWLVSLQKRNFLLALVCYVVQLRRHVLTSSWFFSGAMTESVTSLLPLFTFSQMYIQS